jgi:glutathione S-transferase
MNQLIGICDWYLYPQASSIVAWERIIKPRLTRQVVDEARAAAAIAPGDRSVAEIARLMGEHPWLAGDQFSLADLYLAPHLHYFSITPEGGPVIAAHSRVQRWLDRARARPAFARTQLFGLEA